MRVQAEDEQEKRPPQQHLWVTGGLKAWPFRLPSGSGWWGFRGRMGYGRGRAAHFTLLQSKTGSRAKILSSGLALQATPPPFSDAIHRGCDRRGGAQDKRFVTAQDASATWTGETGTSAGAGPIHRQGRAQTRASSRSAPPSNSTETSSGCPIRTAALHSRRV